VVVVVVVVWESPVLSVAPHLVAPVEEATMQLPGKDCW
jgi:hypothetical protein